MAAVPLETSSTAGLDTETFDYIIVGGGTAGLVVANRLSEDANVRVLVLEAGANRTNDPRVFIPGLAPSTYWNPDFDWAFTSTPQKQLGGRTIAHSMGKTLGGSSAINMGMIIWPAKANFDAWEAIGNPGWGWDSVSTYIRKFHTYNPPSAEVKEQISYEADEAAHGTNGPVQINYGTDYMPYHAAWGPTFKNMNYPLTGDPVTGVSSGAFTSGGAIDPITKTRSHAGAVYWNEEVAKRSNLRVVTEAFVEKVLLKKEEDRFVTATGVRVLTKDGVLREITAAKEVILAAGSFKSPQLLELSGIGNPGLLKLHSIPIMVSNVNVGENLQDHALIPYNYEVADGMPSADIIAKDPSFAAAAMEAYQTARAGPLGQNPLVSSFIPIDLSDAERTLLVDGQLAAHPPQTAAEIAQFEQLCHILDIPGEPTAQYTFAPMQLLSREGPLPSGIFGMSHDGFFVTVVTALNHPFSRGSTHINSAKPADNPVIDTGYLNHPLDLELEARHLLFLEKVMATEPMVSLLKPGGRRIHNYDRSEPITDLEEAKKVARELVVSNWHTSGSCAMQPSEKGGVVSDKLLVYGTSNLRVVDASIFPLIPRGNIQASVFAVAEKAADVIKGEARK